MRFFCFLILNNSSKAFFRMTVQIHSNPAPITAFLKGRGKMTLPSSFLRSTRSWIVLVHVMPVCRFGTSNRKSFKAAGLAPTCQHGVRAQRRGFFGTPFECEPGLDLRPSIEVSSNDLIAPTVSHNLGIGFVPSEFAEHLLNYRVFQLPKYPYPEAPDPRLFKTRCAR